MSNKHTCSACYRKFATAQAWSAHVATHAKLKVKVEDLSVETRKAQFEHNLEKTKLDNANDLEEARSRSELLQANRKRVATFKAGRPPECMWARLGWRPSIYKVQHVLDVRPCLYSCPLGGDEVKWRRGGGAGI